MSAPQHQLFARLNFEINEFWLTLVVQPTPINSFHIENILRDRVRGVGGSPSGGWRQGIPPFHLQGCEVGVVLILVANPKPLFKKPYMWGRKKNTCIGPRYTWGPIYGSKSL